MAMKIQKLLAHKNSNGEMVHTNIIFDDGRVQNIRKISDPSTVFVTANQTSIYVPRTNKLQVYGLGVATLAGYRLRQTLPFMKNVYLPHYQEVLMDILFKTGVISKTVFDSERKLWAELSTVLEQAYADISDIEDIPKALLDSLNKKQSLILLQPLKTAQAKWDEMLPKFQLRFVETVQAKAPKAGADKDAGGFEF